MELMQREKQEFPSGDFIDLYKRWKQTVALIAQNKILNLKWLGFAERVLRNLLLPKQYTRKSVSIRTDYNLDGFSLINDRMQNQEFKKKRLIENESVHFTKFYSNIDRKKDNFEREAERSNHFYLDSNLNNFLAGILDIRIPSVKIYTNQASDALTKQFNADALTYKSNIFFKTGKYDPRDIKGIALLGHELTHATQAKMQNLPEPAMTDFRLEEQQAMDNEKKVLNYFSAMEPYNENRIQLNYSPADNSSKGYRFDSGDYKVYGSPASPNTPDYSANASELNHNQTHVPRTALTSRDLNLPSETSVNLNSTFQLSEQQFRIIKDDIYRDIMSRIRTEFERGG